MDLHVPPRPGSKSNFDVCAEIRGHPVNAESKTRKDEFPFNLPPESKDSTGITSYMGSRATLDPHDAVDLGLDFKPRTADPHDTDTPESTVIRQLLLDGLSQPPDQGCNLIIFGHIEGHPINFEEALRGTELEKYRRSLETGKLTHIRTRAPTGAFCPGEAGVPFQSLSGILWVSMCRDGDNLGRAYKLYLNPNARLPLPSDVIEALDSGMRQWATTTGNQASPAGGGSSQSTAPTWPEVERAIGWTKAEHHETEYFLGTFVYKTTFSLAVFRRTLLVVGSGTPKISAVIC